MDKGFTEQIHFGEQKMRRIERRSVDNMNNTEESFS